MLRFKNVDFLKYGEAPSKPDSVLCAIYYRSLQNLYTIKVDLNVSLLRVVAFFKFKLS